MAGPFALFQSSPEPLPTAAVIDAFEAVERLTRIDAPGMARLAHGILVGDLSQEEATAIHARLEPLGVQIGSDRWLELPRAQGCSAAKLTARGMELRNVQGQSASLEWGTVSVVAAGTFPKGRVVRSEEFNFSKRLSGTVGGSAALIGGYAALTLDASYEYQESDRVALDIVTDEGATRYRIVADRFDYASLGIAIETAAVRNFTVLLREVASRVSGASLNCGAEGVMREPPAVTRYGSPRLFDRETSWHLWRRSPEARDLGRQAGDPYR